MFENSQKKRQTGTGFTNLNRVIGANQNNRLASTIGTGVNKQVDQAKDSLGQAQSRFDAASTQNRLDTDQNKQKVETILSDTSKVADDDVKQFETFRSGRYNGPKELDNEQKVINDANSAQTLGKLGGSSGGRQALLQRFVGGGGGYNSGMQRLDNLLLGNSDTSDLKQAGRNASGLNAQAQNSVIGAREQANYLSSQAQDFGKNVLNKLNTTESGFENTLNTTAQSAAALRAAETKRLQDAFAGKATLSPEELKKYGLEGVDQVYGLDLSNYITNPVNINASTVANSDQYAKLAGLQKLMGSDASNTQSQFLNQFSNAGNADALVKNGIIGFDRGKLDKHLGIQKSNYENALANYGTGEQWKDADVFSGKVQNALGGFNSFTANNLMNQYNQNKPQLAQVDQEIASMNQVLAKNPNDQQARQGLQAAQAKKAQLEAPRQQYMDQINKIQSNISGLASSDPNFYSKIGTQTWWDAQGGNSAQDILSNLNKYVDNSSGLGSNSATGANSLNSILQGLGTQYADVNQKAQDYRRITGEYGIDNTLSNRLKNDGKASATDSINAATSSIQDEAQKAAIQQYLQQLIGGKA